VLVKRRYVHISKTNIKMHTKSPGFWGKCPGSVLVVKQVFAAQPYTDPSFPSNGS